MPKETKSSATVTVVSYLNSEFGIPKKDAQRAWDAWVEILSMWNKPGCLSLNQEQVRAIFVGKNAHLYLE